MLGWASRYATGGFQISSPVGSNAPECGPVIGLTSSSKASAAIAFARLQIGKPYLWGGTGPDAFDCSGLTMMAYRTAGVDIPRTAAEQWMWGPRVDPGQVQPGDLVFFAGAHGTRAAPGHVGIVIGHGLMIDAPSQGLPVRIEPYSVAGTVGFTRPWTHGRIKQRGAGGSGGPGSRASPAIANR
jgi:cell wall-associated NlpC family hydrolase